MYFNKKDVAVVFVWLDNQDKNHGMKLSIGSPLAYFTDLGLDVHHMTLDRKDTFPVEALKGKYILFQAPNSSNIVGQAKSYIRKQLGHGTNFIINDTVHNWPKHVKNQKYTHAFPRQLIFVNNENADRVKYTSPITAYEAPFYTDLDRRTTRLTDQVPVREALKELGNTVILDSLTLADVARTGEANVWRVFISGYSVSLIVPYVAHQDVQPQKSSRDVLEFAMDFVHDHKRFFPNCYVMDLYESSDGKITIAGMVDFESASDNHLHLKEISYIYKNLVD